MSSADRIQLWIAVAAWVTAGSTLGLLCFAAFQVRAIRWSEKKWETVKACNLYDTDPVLQEATRAIYQLSQGSDYSYQTLAPALHSIITILNYFDSLAIGVDQDIYVEEIVKANLRQNIEKAVDVFLGGNFPPIERNHLESLVRMRERWVDRPRRIRA